MSDVTQILAQIESGDPTAVDKLLPLVYEELRRLAAIHMAREDPGQTLQATALVHEAYVRLTGNSKVRSLVSDVTFETSSPLKLDRDLGDINAGSVGSNSVDAAGSRVWRSRQQFFAAAAKAMRHVLVDNARRRRTEKRGGDRRRGQLVDIASPATMSPNDLLDLDEALGRLGQAYPQHAKLVELQFFAGLTQEEAAVCLGISVVTAWRHWVFARAWLFEQLAGATDHKPVDPKAKLSNRGV